MYNNLHILAICDIYTTGWFGIHIRSYIPICSTILCMLPISFNLESSDKMTSIGGTGGKSYVNNII